MSHHRLFTLALIIIGLLAGLDVVSDFRRGLDYTHILVETVIAVVGLLFGLSGVKGIISEYEETTRKLARELAEVEIERKAWRGKAQGYLEGLSSSIRDQFDGWEFTEAERDVALFILKGLSHKEIATLRECSEKTVRQHSSAVYSKSALAGKGQFLAFFLDGLQL